MMNLPTHKQVIDYYLRPDTSQFIWELARRRPLKFYYHSDVDLSRGDVHAHHTPHGIKLHCVPSVGELRTKIQEAAQGRKDSTPGFIPFFNMGHIANEPDQSDKIIGWDLRFEFDFDQGDSFRVLLPILALLEHFAIPILAKYSGHRSLHVMIPAEAFPAKMRQRVVHQEWMDTFQMLGDLFCHFSPPIDRGSTRTAKEMVLTTPYSFHRYYGLLSLPISLKEAMDFEKETAVLANFSGINWHPQQLVDQEDHMTPLLELAHNRLNRLNDIIGLAKKIFVGGEWQSFNVDLLTQVNEPIAATLRGGLPFINFGPKMKQLTADQRTRFRQARLIMDSPEAKEIRFYRLISHVGYGVPAETITAVRTILAAALSHWVKGGLDEVIDYLLALTNNQDVSAPIACAVRILSLLPVDHRLKVQAISARWSILEPLPTPKTAFLALVLGELSSDQVSALAVFADADETAVRLRQIISKRKWLTEQEPDIAIATLCLAFGIGTVTDWLQSNDNSAGRQLLCSIFGDSGNDNKFQFAASKLFKRIE